MALIYTAGVNLCFVWVLVPAVGVWRNWLATSFSKLWLLVVDAPLKIKAHPCVPINCDEPRSAALTITTRRKEARTMALPREINPFWVVLASTKDSSGWGDSCGNLWVLTSSKGPWEPYASGLFVFTVSSDSKERSSLLCASGSAACPWRGTVVLGLRPVRLADFMVFISSGRFSLFLCSPKNQRPGCFIQNASFR